MHVRKSCLSEVYQTEALAERIGNEGLADVMGQARFDALDDDERRQILVALGCIPALE